MDKQIEKVEEVISTFSNAVSEQDKRLWIQEATAKYYRVEYELLLKEDTQLDQEIKKGEEKLKTMEKKIPEVKKTKERLKVAITTTSNITRFLIERLNNTREDVNKWRNKINEKERWMEVFLQEERAKKVNENELYKRVLQKRTSLKLLKIKHQMLLKREEIQKRQINMRLQINKQLFYSKIVTFVRAVTINNRMIEVNREIETTKVALNEMAIKLNKSPQLKIPSFQKNISHEFFNHPKLVSPWSMIKLSTSKSVSTNDTEDNVDLKKLLQRSNERKRIFLQMMDGSLNTKHVPAKMVEKRLQVEKPSIIQAAPSSAEKKIKVRGNVAVPKTAEIDVPIPTKPEEKKVKRVSFKKASLQENENMVWNDHREEHQQSFTECSALLENNTVSHYFQKPVGNVFQDNEVNKSIQFSFMSPEYAAETMYENLNESAANQTITDDFFMTPQENSGRQSIFSDFRFGDNAQQSSGNQFSFF